MTKLQPCASKLRLSKICRWLIALGIAKLALFGAWSVDMPLPQLIFPSGKASSIPAPPAPVIPQAVTRPPADTSVAGALPTQKLEEVRLAAFFAERAESATAKESAGRLLSETAHAQDGASPLQAATASAARAGVSAVHAGCASAMEQGGPRGSRSRIRCKQQRMPGAQRRGC